MSWIGELARRNGNISGKLGIFRGGKFASLHSLPSSLRVGVWTSSRSFHALGKFQRWNSSTFSNFTCTIRNSRFFSNFSNSIGASEKTVSLWLFGVSGLVFTMVVLGGVTRLTRSGLSMVDWKPQGGLPPMSEQEWEDEFKKYQNFPEYQKKNKDMSLDEFKSIFFMEWGHRMFGRLIGVAFSLPMIYFAVRGRINASLGTRLGLLFTMGGTQGLIGWWMVKSGLEEPVMENDKRSSDPRVSPYRLAVHLISAFAIYAFLLSTAFRVIQPISLVPMSAIDRIRSASPSLRRMGLFTTALIFLTAFSGAFVAGNDAGLVYDEFPLMGGKLIPSDIIDEFLAPKWRNMFEHPVMVQWQHRVLALTTLFSIYALTFMCYSRWNLLTSSAQKASLLLFGMGNMQVGLGIATLLYHVPIPLAATHQAGSLALLSSAVFFITSLTPARPLLQSSAALPFLVSAVATRSSSQTTQSSSQTTQSSSQQTKSSS